MFWILIFLAAFSVAMFKLGAYSVLVTLLSMTLKAIVLVPVVLVLAYWFIRRRQRSSLSKTI